MDPQLDTRLDSSTQIAVIGSGVAGLTAAWVLSKNANVTLYEADSRPGGHADTHFVTLESGRVVPVDTGFIVHNDRTYPTLTRLFSELGVQTAPTDMSMSVRCDRTRLEYAGGQGISGILAAPSTVANPRYLRMLLEVKRFHRAARDLLATGGDDDRTLAEFLLDHGFSAFFAKNFMAPLVAAVWSASTETAMQYPAHYLFTFLEHHGMLSVQGSPPWRTVVGGSVEYVRAVTAGVAEMRLADRVLAVRELDDRVEVYSTTGGQRYFDAVVMATHPHQALRALAEPTPLQQSVLSAITYCPNDAVLHTDTSLLPRHRRAQASWNYRLPARAADPVEVTYDMTRLQRITGVDDRRFLVTLGAVDRIDPATIIDTMSYEHPQFTPESVAAQRLLPSINTARVSFAGAYHGWGFHEDGAASGLRAAEHLGAAWQSSRLAASAL